MQAFNNDVEKADSFDADVAVADATADDFDALVLPGGTTNPDQLRLDPDAVGFVKAFAQAGKPIAAICHGPWTLIEADLVRGKPLTSFPSLQTDIRNAGGEWRDEEVVTSSDGGFTLVTSRKPDDLDAFCAAAIEAFAARIERKTASGCKDGVVHADIAWIFTMARRRHAGNGQVVQQRKGLRIHPAR